MKFNKQIIIVLVLLSLLLSALGAAYYFYYQNQKSLQSNNKLVVVYIASKNIKKNSKITKKDLEQLEIAKKYVLSVPLVEKEIIGKFAKENIYKDDMFRKEKVSDKIIGDDNATIIDNFKFNSYNMAFKIFRNPNYSLKKGDIINIISVYSTTEQKSNKSPYSVQYVASYIKVLGFLYNGKETDKTIKKIKVTKTVKKKKVTEEVEVKSDEIILDIDSKVLLALMDDYNRGSQLWMVKTHPAVKKPSVKIKEPVKVKKTTNTVKRSYPNKLYKPKDGFNNFKATIHYADEKEAAVVENKVVKVDMQENCKKSDKYLLAVSRRVSLRSGPSNEYRIKRTVYRNYVIPYVEKVNENWYKTCDGFYIHKNEVQVISKIDALFRLAK